MLIELQDFVKNNSIIIRDRIDNIKNSMFVLSEGVLKNGINYLSTSITNVKYIVVNRKYLPILKYKLTNQIVICVNNTRTFFYYLLMLIYNIDIKKVFLITGTNGKTSLISQLRYIFNMLKIKSFDLNTLDNNKYNSQITSLPILNLFNKIKCLENSSTKYFLIESSSHCISQRRILLSKIKSLILCNFGDDHLNYHINRKHYMISKYPIFFKNSSFIFCDNFYVKKSINNITEVNYNILDYGVYAKCVTIKNNVINFFNKYCKIKNYYNVSNNYILLCIIITVITLGFFSIKKIFNKNIFIKNTYGRMDYLFNEKNKILIDYSHNVSSMSNILYEIRNINIGNIYVLFGCGGNRDNKKRSIIGKIVNQISDFIIVSSDNSRADNDNEIRKNINTQCINGISLSSRYFAIFFLTQKMKTNDILIIAGKGHERYQIIGNECFDYNDYNIKNYFKKSYKQ